MRIFNALGNPIKFPLHPGMKNSEREEIAAGTPSRSIIPSTELLTMLVNVFSNEQIAFIISGPFEMNMCANIPVTASYVVQSLDEALQRFKKPEAPKTPAEELVEKEAEVKAEAEPEPEAVVEEPKVEEPKAEEEEVKTSKKKKK